MDIETLKSIATGVEYIEQTESGFIPHRFSKEEERVYKELRPEYFFKCISSASVMFEFKTDASAVSFNFKAKKATFRSYFAVQVFVNGECKGCVKNFDTYEDLQGNPTVKLPFGGAFSFNADLSDGENEIKIMMPFSVTIEITDFTLDGATYVLPIKKRGTLLAYGDSITHGYDSFYPANSYVNRLADMLDAEVFNKAIGGEIFFPELAEAENSVKPDYVTVAYGTNDHSRGNREKTERDAKLFYETVRRKYPEAKIFAISPIWRKDYDTVKPFGDFHDVEKIIGEAIAGIEGAYLIRGFDLVPHDSKYFADLTLHPNDEGFAYYAKNLFEEIKKYI